MAPFLSPPPPSSRRPLALLGAGALLLASWGVCSCSGSPGGAEVDWQQLAGSAHFTLGGGDTIHLEVQGHDELSRDLVVRPDGMVTVPLVGDVMARDRLPEQLGADIARQIERFVKSPQVLVSLRAVQSYAVYVLGEVRRPGEYRAPEARTLLQALALAGGFTEFADRDRILVLRRQPGHPALSIPVSYKAILSGTAPEQNIFLASGDTVVVP